MPGPADSKKMTPLLWIIIAAVVVIAGFMFFGPNHKVTTPSGETVPASAPPSAPTTTAGS